MKFILPVLALSLLSVSCVSTAPTESKAPKQQQDSQQAVGAPQNIIMVIGDGMGPAYTTAYRYFIDNPETTEIEETVFDRHLRGLSSTYPAPISGVVTDSAASATALASGVKSYNGAIGVDVNKKEVQTVLEWAKLQGKKTGVVVTSQINHATPASYLAHNEHRKNYNAIADSYIDDGIKADLYFGGGWKFFLREDRNLVNEFKQAGFHYLDNYQGLADLPKSKPVLGLFADVGLPWALDDSNKHRLSTMTKAAVHHLTDMQQHDNAPDNGFFMLIEASQIDWAGHGNDISDAMAEMDDMAKTLEYLEHFVEHHPDTLVIVTADHSTGGFTLAANGKYRWDAEHLRTMKHSVNYIAKQLAKNEISADYASDLFNFKLTRKEMKLLITTKDSPKLNKSTNIYQNKKNSPVERALLKQVKAIMDMRTNSGWTSGGHTAIDVPVLAFGKQSDLFNGAQDNTDIAKKIFTLLGK
ncbi:MAG: alkaline phosphatase [Colwellia sp.]|nr:alkaline phosphatase [Colwellia sp.]MCW8864460.1 alkaline phosphatase [Colwellia sp.]MCW9081450.1 alkaline phosphatase [Colwellia sp.]